MSKHFKLSEFSSPGYPVRRNRVPVPAKLVGNCNTLMQELEVIREALGGKPVRVISGYRTLKYNRQNKGRATNSKHLQAIAADIKVKGVSPARVYWVIKELMRTGAIRTGGLAAYPSFTHYDTRGWNARWRRAPKRPTRGLGSKQQ